MIFKIFFFPCRSRQSPDRATDTRTHTHTRTHARTRANEHETSVATSRRTKGVCLQRFPSVAAVRWCARRSFAVKHSARTTADLAIGVRLFLNVSTDATRRCDGRVSFVTREPRARFPQRHRVQSRLEHAIRFDVVNINLHATVLLLSVLRRTRTVRPKCHATVNDL